MESSTLKNIRQDFQDYAGEFAGDEGKLPFLAQLKLDHSMRVADNCRFISSAMGWDAGEVATSEATGILHDVGRFSQLKEFGTYIDRDSVDHGDRAYEVTGARGFLRECTSSDADLVLASIRYHNKKHIPLGLHAEQVRFLRVVRDADKLDIMIVVNDAISNNTIKAYPEVLLGVDPDGPPTPALIEELLEGGGGSYEHIHSLADINLIRTSWVYSINYLPTLQRIRDNRLFDGIWETLPGIPEIEQISGRIDAFIEQALSSGELRGEREEINTQRPTSNVQIENREPPHLAT